MPSNMGDSAMYFSVPSSARSPVLSNTGVVCVWKPARQPCRVVEILLLKCFRQVHLDGIQNQGGRQRGYGSTKYTRRQKYYGDSEQRMLEPSSARCCLPQLADRAQPDHRVPPK